MLGVVGSEVGFSSVVLVMGKLTTTPPSVVVGFPSEVVGFPSVVVMGCVGVVSKAANNLINKENAAKNGDR